MSKYWSPIVSKLSPYVPGEQPSIPDIVKLNTNENPYGPSPRVLAALQAEAQGTLRLYPDPNARRLRESIAKYYGLEVAQIFVGNGSDEVLAFAFQALLSHAEPVLFPDVTYSFYPTYCKLYGIEFSLVPLDPEFGIALTDYDRTNGGIIFANPNAPTGRAVGLAAITDLLKKQQDSVVVVDEAYVDFGAESAASLVSQFPNLLVVQTFSKSRALAGLRVGFALGHPDLIEALERIKNSFNSYPLDRFAQAGATAAMEDREWFDATCRKVVESRGRMVSALQALGFEVLPSSANFVFARHPRAKASALLAGLREHSIVVRHFSNPRIEDFLRITVGTDAQCQRLEDTLRGLLGEKALG